MGNVDILMVTEAKTEVNLRKVKWHAICSYNPHKNYISNHIENLSDVLNRNLKDLFV